MGLFNKRAAANAEIERLTTEIASMAARLDTAETASAAAAAELGERVDGIVTRLDTPIGPPPATPPPVLVGRTDVDGLQRQIAELFARIDAVDARVTAISTELAYQLEELSREVGDSTSQAAPSEEMLDEALGDLRDAQTRLANEQARYQIAFRQDLAELADRLRRS